MKILDRELARAKVTANRVAVVVANEWKDANEKVMPVRQWLEERRFMQVSNNNYIVLSRSIGCHGQGRAMEKRQVFVGHGDF